MCAPVPRRHGSNDSLRRRPAGPSEIFEDAGCSWIHVVDLNGAFEGKPVNEKAVISILNAISIPIQLGGGVREMATVDFWLERGVRRVIWGQRLSRIGPS